MKTLIIRLQEELHRKLKTIVAKKGLSMQKVVEKMIKDYTDNDR